MVKLEVVFLATSRAAVKEVVSRILKVTVATISG